MTTSLYRDVQWESLAERLANCPAKDVCKVYREITACAKHPLFMDFAQARESRDTQTLSGTEQKDKMSTFFEIYILKYPRSLLSR